MERTRTITGSNAAAVTRKVDVLHLDVAVYRGRRAVVGEGVDGRYAPDDLEAILGCLPYAADAH